MKYTNLKFKLKKLRESVCSKVRDVFKAKIPTVGVGHYLNKYV